MASVIATSACFNVDEELHNTVRENEVSLHSSGLRGASLGSGLIPGLCSPLGKVRSPQTVLPPLESPFAIALRQSGIAPDDVEEKLAENLEAMLKRMSFKKKVHAIFEAEGMEEEIYAEKYFALSRCVFAFTLVLIVTSVTVFSVESLPQYYGRGLEVFFVIECICIGWFTFELIVRFLTCDSKKTFASDILNWVDLVSILPFYLDIVMLAMTGSSGKGNGLVVLRVIRLTRMFRVFKLSKYNEGIQTVGRALKNSTDALSLLLFLTVITTVLFGSGIFFAEQLAADFNDETKTWVRKEQYGGPIEKHPFKSIPHSFWWCLVTVTTVGYGDMYPVTGPGYFVGACAMLTGLLIVAFPIIILGANFSEAREQLARLKEEERQTKLRLLATMLEETTNSTFNNVLLPTGGAETSERDNSSGAATGSASSPHGHHASDSNLTVPSHGPGNLEGADLNSVLLQQILQRLDAIETNVSRLSTELSRSPAH